MDYEKLAKDEEKQAGKKLQGSFFGNLFGSKNERVENAMEHLSRAGNYYKLAAKYENAGITYKRLAEMSQQIQEFDDAADFLSSAGDMFAHVDSGQAAKCLQDSSILYQKSGKIAKAAKVYRQMAEAFENDIEYDRAITNYEKAAELFALEKHNETDVHKCNLKVAQLCSQEPDKAGEEKLVKAIKIYEKTAKKYMENNLLRHSSKDLWVKSLLLFMVLEDDVGYERANDSYIDQDPSFSNNYELKLLKKLHAQYMAKDSDGFSMVSMDWHQKSNLDKWKTNVLSQIKRGIEKKNPPKKNKKKESDSEDDYEIDNYDNNKGGEDEDDYNPY